MTSLLGGLSAWYQAGRWRGQDELLPGQLWASHPAGSEGLAQGRPPVLSFPARTVFLGGEVGGAVVVRWAGLEQVCPGG